MKNLIADYSGYLGFRALGFILRFLPLEVNLSLGRLIGTALYYFDLRHRGVCYANIKRALGDSSSARQLSGITKGFYQNFGQSLIEIFMIPRINKKYFSRFIKITGKENIDKAFSYGKGVIFLAVHSGSWELSNVVCANLGFPFNLLVRDQRHARIDRLLNNYRRQKGCKLITRQNQTRALIEALKNNEAIGITFDQGGKGGNLVKFFGQEASFATGAIRMALKYGAVILPAYHTRIRGAHLETVIQAPFQLKKTGDKENDVRDNLTALVPVFENFIRKYPKDYFWSYKIWKYGRQRKVLVLSDGKPGHLHQAQAVAQMITRNLRENNINVELVVQEVKFKGRFGSLGFFLSAIFSGKYSCQGCLWCLRKFLDQGVLKRLSVLNPDIIVSCGSSLAGLNYILARQNLAKSVVVLRPSVYSLRRFDLVIMPRHDRPQKRKNVLATEGMLNLISQDYLSQQSQKLKTMLNESAEKKCLRIGVLLGGNAREFILSAELILEVVRAIKSIAETLGAEILLTTSRRTSREVEQLLKRELQGYAPCKLLVIANEKNIPEAVGGILGLCQVIIVSPESTSMVSEAASSGKYVVAFEAEGLIRRHRDFLRHLSNGQYIYYVKPQNLKKVITGLWADNPKVNVLRDNLLVAEALKKIF